jgi:DNA-binding IscR family transcriptional regulator
VEGPIAMTSCGEGGRHDCTLEAACQLRPQWPQVNRAVRGALAQVSLTQLAEPVA